MIGPTAPNVGAKLLWTQFRKDIYGKEVQSAATYSYLWIADQTGHLCLGIIINFLLTAIAVRTCPVVFGAADFSAQMLGFAGTAFIVSAWEYSAFRTDVRKATPPFRLDKRLLAANATVAAFYMILGAALGWAFHRPFDQAAVAGLLIAVAALVAAPRWLRQKIVWQKASLPYLFRLADTGASVLEPAARALEAMIAEAAPPGARPLQVVLAGPIGSGRTMLACAIGTEFAFRQRSVRYLSLDRLIEFATAQDPAGNTTGFGDDAGPANIEYWKWTEAQVLVIDDIGPVIAATPGLDALTQFKAILAGPLAPIKGLLGCRHTVWILGDLGDQASSALDRFGESISNFCGSAFVQDKHPLGILLRPGRLPEVHSATGADVSVPVRR